MKLNLFEILLYDTLLTTKFFRSTVEETKEVRLWLVALSPVPLSKQSRGQFLVDVPHVRHHLL